MCYQHKLWKDYKNSENTGNRNFTKTWNGPERKFRLTANNQYFNLGLNDWYLGQIFSFYTCNYGFIYLQILV